MVSGNFGGHYLGPNHRIQKYWRNLIWQWAQPNRAQHNKHVLNIGGNYTCNLAVQALTAKPPNLIPPIFPLTQCLLLL